MADDGLILDVGDYFPTTEESVFDQLTQVRNYVRHQFATHENIEAVKVSVIWQNGDVEELMFDKWVGYPQGTDEKFWFQRWTTEAGL